MKQRNNETTKQQNNKTMKQKLCNCTLCVHVEPVLGRCVVDIDNPHYRIVIGGQRKRAGLFRAGVRVQHGPSSTTGRSRPRRRRSFLCFLFRLFRLFRRSTRFRPTQRRTGRVATNTATNTAVAAAVPPHASQHPIPVGILVLRAGLRGRAATPAAPATPRCFTLVVGAGVAKTKHVFNLVVQPRRPHQPSRCVVLNGPADRFARGQENRATTSTTRATQVRLGGKTIVVVGKGCFVVQPLAEMRGSGDVGLVPPLTHGVVVPIDVDAQRTQLTTVVRVEVDVAVFAARVATHRDGGGVKEVRQVPNVVHRVKPRGDGVGEHGSSGHGGEFHPVLHAVADRGGVALVVAQGQVHSGKIGQGIERVGIFGPRTFAMVVQGMEKRKEAVVGGGSGGGGGTVLVAVVVHRSRRQTTTEKENDGGGGESGNHV
jgi:hypothetical protein